LAAEVAPVKTICAVAALALALVGNAWAHNGQEGSSHTHWYLETDISWYAGASVAQGTFKDWSVAEGADDGSYVSRDVDDSDTGLRVFAGVDLGRYFALELGYADFGDAGFSGQSDGSGTRWAAGPVNETIELKALDLELFGKLPLTEAVALFGKVGAFQWRSTTEGSGTFQCCGPVTFNQSNDGREAAYGAGVQYDGLRPLRVVAEYTTATFGETLLQQNRKVESIALSLVYLLE